MTPRPSPSIGALLARQRAQAPALAVVPTVVDPDDQAPTIANIQPLLDRVRRGDHWRKPNGSGPVHTKLPLADLTIEREWAAGNGVGACPIERGGRTTRIAVLDLDSHKGEATWPEMWACAKQLIEVAEAVFDLKLIPFRSTGGRGIHLYALWAEPQDARSVRVAMRELLASCRLKDGAGKGGVKGGFVEVFPKQDSVPTDGWGSMFVLPGSGKSAALGSVTGEVIAWASVDWRMSGDVEVLPPDEQRDPVEPIEVTDASVASIQSALAAIDPNTLDYDGWLRMLMAVSHGTGGSDAGLAIFHEWSSRAGVYDEAETDKQWAWCDPARPGGVTVDTLFAVAKKAGWRDPQLQQLFAANDEARADAFLAAVPGWEVAGLDEAGIARAAELPAPVRATVADRVGAADARAIAQAAEAIEAVRASKTGAQRKLLSSVGLTVELPSAIAYNDKRRALATAPNVALACQSPDMIGCVIGFDSFRDELMLSHDGGQNWASFRDEHYAQIEVRLVNEHRFMPIPMELLRRQVYAAGQHNSFDSAQKWLESLPPWDGVPRVDRFCATYLGAEDREYTGAVSAFLWTAAAGRVMVPGIKVDMVPVLVGAQGARKSSSIAAISPSPDFFNEIAFDTKDADLSRKLKGLLVGELAELRGLGTKEIEAIKNFITQRHETWTPKFKEIPVRFARRCVFIGSTNEEQFLADKTGERRWLPVTVGECRPDLVERDRLQLWAEGLARFRANGIEWQRAEQLAAGEHEAYKAPDLWEDRIVSFLDTAGLDGVRPGDRPFTMTQILVSALGIDVADATKVKRADENRVGKILRGLGYESLRRRVDGVRGRFWERKR
ncbi:VapE domain-containing protein [Zeimonas arvi]|uniref:Uncharacterized protein n=1 Tax=Zeimonas arvi TaxID=2498847 RepID=A0A5C8NRV2_9BURK|nr:VapE domain-containing protein [Zeimonas arvi]TXL63555.1 hypothetical protein FHP08_17115 [Zeimonas arvi]